MKTKAVGLFAVAMLTALGVSSAMASGEPRSSNRGRADAAVPLIQAATKVVYVAQGVAGNGSGTDWADACTSITAGLNTSVTGDEIWVKNSTYFGAITMKVEVALYGGFRGREARRDQRDWATNVTVIDGSKVLTPVVVGADLARLDGFTIRRGCATDNGGGVYCQAASPTLANCIIRDNRAMGENEYGDGLGGGIYCCGNSSPILANCIITDNSATWAGGGVYSDRYSSPTLTNCTITGNSAWDGGGVMCYYSSLTLTNCTTTGNSASFGGGLFCWQSSCTLTNCNVSGNSATDFGSGVCCTGPLLTLTNCTISGNSGSSFGGGVSCDSTATLTSCTITGNSSWRGGGVYCEYSSSPTLTNCTINGNSATDLGGGVYCEHFSPSLTNCILWNDSPGEIGLSGDSYDPTVSFSDIQGGYAGEGNINSDPRFVHPWDGQRVDLHLLPDSPCIDTATSAGAPNEDADGLPRPYDVPGLGPDGPGQGYDMGAYEYYPAGYVSPTPTASPTSTFNPTITPTTTFTPTITPTSTPYCGYVLLDGYGGLHQQGAAETLFINPDAPYFGWDIAREVEMVNDGSHRRLVLDGYGCVWTIGEGARLPMVAYFAPFDRATSLAATADGQGYYLLDRYGLVYPAGSANAALSGEAAGMLFPGQALRAVKIAVTSDLNASDQTIYVLDSFGGVYVQGKDAAQRAGAARAYFGWDIARDIVLLKMEGAVGMSTLTLPSPVEGEGIYGRGPVDESTLTLPSPVEGEGTMEKAAAGEGIVDAVLDGYGGLHLSDSDWQTVVGADFLSHAPYWGFDIARAIAFTDTQHGAYILDGYGAVHALGDAPALPGVYFMGINGPFDIARDIAFYKGE